MTVIGIDASRVASRAAEQARRVANRAFNEARSVLGSDGTTFLSVEAQESYLRRIREVRVDNDVKHLEMTLINNQWGSGCIVSALGFGTASQAGIVVGDVIEYVNGVKVMSHEHAFETMHACTCRDLAFSLLGSPRTVCIDKAVPGKVQITLANRKAGPGVEVEGVGIMGLAANAGIAVGDVVLSINGILVDDHAAGIVMLDSSERWVELVLAEKEVEGRRPQENQYHTAPDHYRIFDDSLARV